MWRFWRMLFLPFDRRNRLLATCSIYCGKIGRRIFLPDAALVIAQDHVHDPVQRVLYPPVITDGGGHDFFSAFSWQLIVIPLMSVLIERLKRRLISSCNLP